MTRSLSSRLITLISLTIGIVFWTLPDRWIESHLRISPDGGSGVLELVLVVIPIVLIGAAKLEEVRSFGPGKVIADHIVLAVPESRADILRI